MMFEIDPITKAAFRDQGFYHAPQLIPERPCR